MIPLRDVIPSRTTPWVTLALIAVNLGVYAVGLGLTEEEHLDRTLTFGLTPAFFSWMTLLTSMFLHGGFVHVAGNLLSLWIFGDNVEDRMGHGRFLIFYLLCGAAAAWAQVWADPVSAIPMIGASGAIAGVMGAYLVMFPHSRVLVLVFFVLFVDIIEVPALVVLVLWFLSQFLYGLGDAGGGIAFWAHIGGFVAGLGGVFLFRRRQRQEPSWWAERDN